jgi:two-component system CheB/CheR fusion protein
MKAVGRSRSLSNRAGNSDPLRPRKLWSQPQLARPSALKATRVQTARAVFPVVGIGASAGGLEAFTELLRHLPPDTGMAFVLIQHLDPTHESALTTLLARTTTLPVLEVRNKMPLAPNHVYVIPPGSTMTIADGVLKVLKSRREGPSDAVDQFLESLARDRGPQAIGVILSGSASDGTRGLEAIKGEGGITFAQDASAKYDGMPRSAIAAGCVDFALPPAKIAAELASIARHPQLRPASADDPPPPTNGYKQILQLLRIRTGVDFTLYKAPTILRRLARRMVLAKAPTFSAYQKHLREHPAEAEALYQDLLINVTDFFRNPETFEVLKQKVFPRLLKDRTPNQPVRLWVLGCSTGQEAYSMAMAFLECTARARVQIPVQIFATDLNEVLLERARAGLYSHSQIQGLSPERLRRFFIQEEGGYRVCKPIREACVFAKHDVLTDPPFSRIDLLSCRNVMIYLEPALQKRLLPIFHYALKPGGFLVLGSSETIGAFGDLFATEDKNHRFYSRKATAQYPQVRLEPKTTPSGITSALHKYALPQTLPVEAEAEKQADRLLLAKYAPAGVLLNESLEVLQFRGQTGRYLEPPIGKPSANLLKLLRQGLLVPVRAAIQKARREGRAVRLENLEFQSDNQSRRIHLEAVPLKNLKERRFLLLFEPAEPQAPARQKPNPSAPIPAIPANLQKALRANTLLREELAATKEYLQALTEQYEAANEELQAANEEAQSSNEELQSINEEIQTTKEELQSTNEELTTLNEELGSRNTELHRTNSALSNVFSGAQMCIVVLGADLCVRRFTPLAEKLLNLVATDVGRPIGNIRPNFEFSNLEDALLNVINTVSPRETEVQDKAGHWYSLRLLPYKTLDNKIDGAVMALVDIDALKRSEQRIQAALDYSESIIETVREPLLVLNARLQVELANRSFYDTFRLVPGQTQGCSFHHLSAGQWDIPELRALLQKVLSAGRTFNDFEVAREFEQLGQRNMLLNGRPIPGEGGRPERILLAIEDVTERRQLEQRDKQRTAELRDLVQELETFSYSVSHDLRSPIRAMSGFAHLALQEAGPHVSPRAKNFLERILAGANRADRLIQDVLSYSRVSRENIHLGPVDLEKLLREITVQQPNFQSPAVAIQVQTPLLKVLAHEPSLGQCLTNLLSNAVKFVPPDTVPHVKIWTEPVDGQVRVWFEDNGIGIGPENLGRIFGLFERVHSNKEYEGTGIGLAIVRKSIDRMGGKVGVESELGAGSRFWIQLNPPQHEE